MKLKQSLLSFAKDLALEGDWPWEIAGVCVLNSPALSFCPEISPSKC